MSAANKLRELAMAATPGPWRVVLPGDLSWGERRKYRCVEFDKATGEDTSPLAPANARFIAALNPTVALALADLIEAADGLWRDNAGHVCHDPECPVAYAGNVLTRVEEAIR